MNPERFYAVLYLVGITVSSISITILFWITYRHDMRVAAEERRRRWESEDKKHPPTTT